MVEGWMGMAEMSECVPLFNASCLVPLSDLRRRFIGVLSGYQ
jgi:hypothetical protein